MKREDVLTLIDEALGMMAANPFQGNEAQGAFLRDARGYVESGIRFGMVEEHAKAISLAYIKWNNGGC